MRHLKEGDFAERRKAATDAKKQLLEVITGTLFATSLSAIVTVALAGEPTA